MKHGSVYTTINSVFLTIFFILLLGFAMFLAFASPRSALPTAAVLVASLLGLYSFGVFSKKISFLIVSIVVLALLFVGIFSQAEALSLVCIILLVAFYVCHYDIRLRTFIERAKVIQDTLSSITDYGKYLDTAIEEVRKISPSSVAFIILRDTNGALYLPATFPRTDDIIISNSSMTYRSCNKSITLNIPHLSPSKDRPLDKNALSAICIPLIAMGETIGVLQLESARISAYSHDDEIKLSLLAQMIAKDIFMFQLEI
ncbi:MAG: GAF domain-containing protein [Synergistaceae bacterium]|nr:GAF domain-containing protein [Synergistaceae bacterium]